MTDSAVRIWYNHGYSQTRDAFVLLRQASHSALTLFATSTNARAPVLAEADVFQLEPTIDRKSVAGQDAYADWCLDFAHRNCIDVFVVQRGRSIIARRAEAFAAIGVRLVIAATADMLDLIEDKARFYEHCANAGLPTPASHEVRSVDAFDNALRAISALGFDACIKPPQGVFGAGYWRLDDSTTLFGQLMAPDERRLQTGVVRAALREMEQRLPRAPMPRVLVMQYLPGSEWSVDCVCDRGTIVAGVTRQKIGASQIVGADPKIMALARRVAETFGLSNLVNIQFKAADADNSLPHVLEINARMSGGCFYADLAGLNLPAIQLQQALGTLDRSSISPPRRLIVAAVNKAIELLPSSHADDGGGTENRCAA